MSYVRSVYVLCLRGNTGNTGNPYLGIFYATAHKMKFSIKDFFTCTEEILSGKPHFVGSENPR